MIKVKICLPWQYLSNHELLTKFSSKDDILLTGWIHPVSIKVELLIVDFCQKPDVSSKVQRTQKTSWANLNQFLRKLIHIEWKHFDFGLSGVNFCQKPAVSSKLQRTQKTQWTNLKQFVLQKLIHMESKHFDFDLSGVFFVKKQPLMLFVGLPRFNVQFQQLIVPFLLFLSVVSKCAWVKWHEKTF